MRNEDTMVEENFRFVSPPTRGRAVPKVAKAGSSRAMATRSS